MSESKNGGLGLYSKVRQFEELGFEGLNETALCPRDNCWPISHRSYKMVRDSAEVTTTNRKSHVTFRLVTKSMILNDRE